MFERKIDIDNISVALAAPIYLKHSDTIALDIDNRFWIVGRSKTNKFYDILYGKGYKYFNKLSFKDCYINLHDTYVDENNVFTLRQLLANGLKEKKETIKLPKLASDEVVSIDELKTIYNRINHIEGIEDEMESDDISDFILKEIIRLKELISTSVDDDTFNKLRKELVKLGEDYAKDIITNTDNKYMIRQKYINKIVDLEFEIRELNDQSNNIHDINDMLELFKSRMK